MTDPVSRLNPTTRKRLWYIAVFLAMDSIAAFYASSIMVPSDVLALVAWFIAALSVVGCISLVSFLVVTREGVESLKSQRSRE
jgi:hypothetical protein